MLQRILEPEVMDSTEEAHDYDAMDHQAVNALFVTDLLAVESDLVHVLDVGTGTAQIPLELCRRHPTVQVTAVDLAKHMLAVAQQNVERAGFAKRITLELIDAKRLPFTDGQFAAIMSNSIVHHIPKPTDALREMVRVCQAGGRLFVRDLLRPDSDAALKTLVQTYAGAANAHQRQMFGDSLHAALTLDEVRDIVKELGFAGDAVKQTSDRHWTWTARK